MKKSDVYRKAVDHLEKVTAAFEKELEKPELIQGRFVYTRPTVKHACLLKGIRIISGLNALALLLGHGYITEMGVLMRTIGDCLNDIYFLLENFPEATPEVERYITNFFDEGSEEPTLTPEQEKKIYRTKARKIHASRARLLSEHTNLLVDRDMIYNIYSAYSGYVHASCPSIMEMYYGHPHHKFHLKGMRETSRIKEWDTALTALIRSTTLVFGYMAEKYERSDIARQIREIMDWFDTATMHAETGR